MNSFSRSQLEAMTDEELLQLEDDLLFKNELTARWKIRASAGRMVIFFVTAILWALIFMGSLEPLKAISGKMSPLNQFIWVIASGIIALFVSGGVWKVIGLKGRQITRTSLHYWPVTIPLIVMMSSTLRKLFE